MLNESLNCIFSYLLLDIYFLGKFNGGSRFPFHGEKSRQPYAEALSAVLTAVGIFI